MPGGHKEAWPHIKPIFQGIAAKADGEPCCDWVGEDGAGHYVKMVHNGIEYGDMQLICEAYHLMKDALGMSSGEMSEVFDEWNKGELDSFLIEITANILKYKDDDGINFKCKKNKIFDIPGSYLVEKIRDAAGQKGTGKWTAISGLEYGMPVTLIAESVFARCLSSIKDERVKASTVLSGPSDTKFKGDKKEFIESKKDLYKHRYPHHETYVNVFLGKIKEAFDKNSDLSNLLLDKFFSDAIHECQDGWRQVVSQAVLLGIPTPALSCALAFFDGYRSARVPANLIQAQRDYFGAHTYELDADPGKFVHTNWTGTGGNISASTYQA
ncbi:6-phosphogluconate dehydrogenase, decarboxylating [Armadillidium vulgare]|nr:6-phosphogluconate dehydrogenase, decarboxylating [Armadillidium vulgare]